MAEIRVTPSPHLTRGGGACSARLRKLLTSWGGIFNYQVVGEETPARRSDPPIPPATYRIAILQTGRL